MFFLIVLLVLVLWALLSPTTLKLALAFLLCVVCFVAARVQDPLGDALAFFVVALIIYGLAVLVRAITPMAAIRQNGQPNLVGIALICGVVIYLLRGRAHWYGTRAVEQDLRRTP